MDKEQDALLAKVALTVQKHALAASGKLGYDCHIHAALGCELLKDSGATARLAVGSAAWRIGPGEQDVISHVDHGSLPTTETKAFSYHAWIECFDSVVDLTTYQLGMKARILDDQDGGRTTVEWCPAYFVLPRRQILSLPAFESCRTVGAAYYEERPELAPLLSHEWSLSPVDLSLARLIFRNPAGINVIGPNNMP